MPKGNYKRQVVRFLFCAYPRATAMSLLLALATGPTVAQPLSALSATKAEISPFLTLQEAVALALQANLDLTVAQREIEAMQGQVLQGQARPNPELEYVLEDQRTASRTQSLQINLPIELGGKRAARIAAAERGRDVAVEELNARRVEVRANVIAAFFDALAAQERAELAQDSVDLARKATDAVAKRVAAGKVSPVEESKARVAEAGVRVELTQAQSEQRSARSRLTSLLGPNPPQFTQVTGNVNDLPVVPSLDDIQQRLSGSPALRRARLEVARRSSLAEVERSKRIPDITVSLGVKRPNELQRNQLMLGVSVPLPLFDRNQGNLLEALKRENKAQYELQALDMRLSTEVLQARERLASVRSEIDILQREVLPGAKSAYDAVTVGFGYGKFNFLEVLDAQRTYFSAKSQYLKALAEAHRAAAEMDRVIGQPEPQITSPANRE